ncbi:MAG: response regulator transcription factor [Vampirovibrionales bacterium]|nr:response regulator transcription factor [Vampirovibrionales bacterium]
MTPFRVLIVDDSKLMRVSLKTAIEQTQDMACVGEAADGREGVYLTGQLKPDIVLMDIGMPILNGIAATREIRKQFPQSKVVMLTSHEGDSDVLDAFQSGATSYCLKDTPPEQLMQIIRTTAGGACWIDPKVARVLVTQVSRPLPDSSLTQAEALQTDLLIPLSEREVEVLRLITEGKNNAEIAELLSISNNTVKTHVKNIFQKLGVEDRTAAALKALKERLV